MEVCLKTALKFLITLILVSWLSSCANKDKIYEGLYDGFNQLQDMNNTEEARRSEKEHPTYQQYKKERQEIFKNKEEGK